MILMGFYLLNVTTDYSFIDIFAYCGYKYISYASALFAELPLCLSVSLFLPTLPRSFSPCSLSARTIDLPRCPCASSRLVTPPPPRRRGPLSLHRGGLLSAMTWAHYPSALRGRTCTHSTHTDSPLRSRTMHRMIVAMLAFIVAEQTGYYAALVYMSCAVGFFLVCVCVCVCVRAWKVSCGPCGAVVQYLWCAHHAYHYAMKLHACEFCVLLDIAILCWLVETGMEANCGRHDTHREREVRRQFVPSLLSGRIAFRKRCHGHTRTHPLTP